MYLRAYYKGLYFLVLLSLGSASFATPGSPVLRELLVRSSVNTTPDGCHALMSHDPLLNEMLLTHIQVFRSGETGVGSAYQRAFDATWLLHTKFNELRNKVIDHFISANDSSPGINFLDWLKRWEESYSNNDIRVSSSWKTYGRRKFLRQMILEMAFATQKRRPEGAQWDKPAFWEIEPDAKFFVDKFEPAIAEAFGNKAEGLRAFQMEYNRYFLKHAGLRFPRVKDYALRDTTRALRQAGIDYSKYFHPWVANFRTRQIQENTTLHWSEIVRRHSFKQYYLPLVGLFKLDSESRLVDLGTLKQFSEFGTLQNFITQVNLELESLSLERIYPGVGLIPETGLATNQIWQKELMLQAALLQYYFFRKQIDEEKQFVGFALSDAPEDIRDNPWIIDPSNEVWQQSQMSIQELNWLITVRLSEPLHEPH